MSRFLLAFLAVCAALPLSAARAADDQAVVGIYMPSPWLACIDWGTCLAGHGFRVVYKETADMAEVKRHLPRVAARPFVVGEANQTAVRERLRPAFGLAVAQRDVDLRRQRPQMARRHHPPQPPPTTTMRSPSPAARVVGGKAL